MRLSGLFSRTVARARWDEYRSLLSDALALDYSIVSVESWLDVGPGGRTLILRHDVDQQPSSALEMAAIERELGLTSTWYFRWRTAHPAVIAALREDGFGIGFHYETLTRSVLESGLPPSEEDSIAESRALLRREIAAFKGLFGPLTSATPHGDSRVPSVSNAPLLRGEDWSSYGLRYDANEAMRGRGLRFWLTDRSASDGRWVNGVEPRRLLEQDVGPILCLTHPNNWSSGASLWVDRLLRWLPSRSVAIRGAAVGPSRLVRTGSDRPQLPA